MIEEYKNKLIEFVQEHKKEIKIALFIFIVGGMAFRGAMQIPQIMSLKSQIAQLNSQIEYEKERQNEVVELMTKVDTDEYIEKIASEKLGLIKSNAKVFVDVSVDQQ
ncbi:MAG: septum formation initiator family protein [Clostridia bacterium]|nr:septum formation initiator family protein [Clostridia bacterium]